MIKGKDQASLALFGGTDRARRSLDERRIDGAGQIVSEPVRNPDFIHSALANVYLPVRNPGDHITHWERRNGGMALRIEAGVIGIKDTNEFREVGLPWGSRARLILIYLTTRARASNSPIIEVGSSLLAFMRRLGLDGRGEDYSSVTDQLQRLLAARIHLLVPGDNRHLMGLVAREMPMWNADHRLEWREEVVLSDDFFQTVKAHSVPLDERAIALLKNSALGLDVYAWLAARLCRIEHGQHVRLPWTHIKAQFGPDVGEMKKFRQTFRGVLKRVSVVYPAAQKAIMEEDDHVILLPAAPPVAPRLRSID